MRDVLRTRERDLGVGHAGEHQELVDLVRGDVDEDAAVLRLVVEPRVAQRAVLAVRPEAHGLHDVADRAVAHEVQRARHRPYLEALGEVHRPDALRLLLHATHGIQLLERGDARLVGHEVLAGAHRLDRVLRTIAGDRRAGDELHARVLE